MTSKIVKICGIRRLEDAEAAIDAGADMLGVIMVPKRARTIDPAVAKEIAKSVKSKRAERKSRFSTAEELNAHISTQSFSSYHEYLSAYHDLILQNGPFLTGVFRNQEPKEVFKLASELGLDFIQLHGDEDPSEYVALNADNKFCIVKRFVLPTQTEYMSNFLSTLHTADAKGFALPLLDSELGGEGKTIDWSLINDLSGSFILAGGLTPENLKDTKAYIENVVGFDVSGGVEDSTGFKDHSKIRSFVVEGKKLGA